MAFPTSIDATSPAGTDSPSLGDDQIRALKTFIEDIAGVTDGSTYTAGGFTYQTTGVVEAKNRWSLKKGAAIASAATVTPGTDGNFFHITGTTGITAIASINGVGPIVLTFDDAVVITHNATSLILQGGVNITTAAGDVFIFFHEGSGNWREIGRILATQFAAPGFTLGTTNAAGSAKTSIRSDATIAAFDSTNPADLGTAAPGTANIAARRDHVHGGFDSTNPTNLGTAAPGTTTIPSRRDHVHGSGLPANVNVLGNRTAAGEFIQRSSGTIGVEVATRTFASGAVAAVTFAVAFSTTPRVLATDQSNNDAVGTVSGVSTTGFTIGNIGRTTQLDSHSIAWLALGT